MRADKLIFQLASGAWCWLEVETELDAIPVKHASVFAGQINFSSKEAAKRACKNAHSAVYPRRP